MIKVVFNQESWFVGDSKWYFRLFLDNLWSTNYIIQAGSAEFKAFTGKRIRVQRTCVQYSIVG